MVNIVYKSQDYSIVNKTKDNLSCLTLKCEKTFHNHCLVNSDYWLPRILGTPEETTVTLFVL